MLSATATSTHPPQRVQLVGAQLEVLVGERARRRGREAHVGPAAQELHHGLERVEREAVVAVVGHVRHEHVDLITKGGKNIK